MTQDTPTRDHDRSDDLSDNGSATPTFDDVMRARIARRGLLRGVVGGAATALLGGLSLSACGGSGGGGDDRAPAGPAEKLLGFTPVAKSLADAVMVPAGYTATVVYALGDPLTAGTPAYRNDGSDDDFGNRAGDHHDGMEFYGLTASGQPSATANDRGVIAMNHEATTNEGLPSFFLHATGGTNARPRPAAEVDKEVAIHGLSVVEMAKSSGRWAYVQNSPFNRRITPLTEVELHGPARGHALLVTRFSPGGTQARGTLNNCGTGRTPWGTYLSGEENWAGYFTRGAADDAARGDKSVVALRRYGRNQGATSRHGWETAGTGDAYDRWNIGRLGASVDGSDDYRNELNTFGYIVEIDPYDKTRALRKRTALGRFAHEAASFSKPVVGQPLACYMGDDSQGEYIYKFVSDATWTAADATPADRLAAGDRFLDAGRLHVATFAADGTGSWIELSIANPAIAGYTAYAFADQADVLVNARLAADAVGATRMDRPEWSAVNPATGDVYVTLTNNSNRRVEPTGSQRAPDAANPRAYSDVRGGTTTGNGNVNGHVIRLREAAGGAAATGFTWDVYLFGAEAGAAPSHVNLSGLTAEQDFSSPDGLAFAASTGICWLQTDDGAYVDVTNCMMLAGLPGTVGDGDKVTLSHARATGGPLVVDTWVGKQPTADTLKRFLVGPSGCEITGITETPDGRTLFVNIQHPGETTAAADIGTPSKYTSHWPANAGYGAGQRPRSATIAITRDDGGRIGT